MRLFCTRALMIAHSSLQRLFLALTEEKRIDEQINDFHQTNHL